jgi:hypothetical protein
MFFATIALLALFPASSVRYSGMQLDAVYINAAFGDKKNDTVDVKLHFYDKKGLMWVIDSAEEILIHHYDNDNKLIHTTHFATDMTKAPVEGPWCFRFALRRDARTAAICVQYRAMKTGLISIAHFKAPSP